MSAIQSYSDKLKHGLEANLRKEEGYCHSENPWMLMGFGTPPKSKS
jgi:hypothetical protein